MFLRVFFFESTPTAYQIFIEESRNIYKKLDADVNTRLATPTPPIQNQAYSLTNGSRRPTPTVFQSLSSSIIWPTRRCGVLCCPIRPNTRAFRCFHIDQAMTTTNVSNPLLCFVGIVFLASNHHAAKVALWADWGTPTPTLDRHRCHTSLAYPQCTNM